MIKFHVLRHAITPHSVYSLPLWGTAERFTAGGESVRLSRLGQATIDAGCGDIPLLMGIVMFCAILIFIGNSTADILLRRVNQE